MPKVRVDPEDVAGLGQVMTDIAEVLDAATAMPRRTAAAYGTGETAAALEELLGSWDHERLALGRALTGLGSAAVAAGGAYVQVEAQTTSAFQDGHTGRGQAGGPTW